MSLFKIVIRNIAQRKLASALTMFSIALGVAAVTAILSLQHQADDYFGNSEFGYDLIVGTTGSETQLVLNTVYHVDQSPGNIPFDIYKKLKAHPYVSKLAPISVGDQYGGFRIVGTTGTYFKEFEARPDVPFTFADGGPFGQTDQDLAHALEHGHAHDQEAVVGSYAAARTGLKVGDTFAPVHGVETRDAEDGHVHEGDWKVLGVLEPTGTPADRAIFINIDSFFAIKEHSSDLQEISAILVKARDQGPAMMLRGEVASWPNAMAVFPADAIGGLMEKFAPIAPLLLVVSAFVIIVAGISILVSIYNSMAERRRAIAIMRALGARRGTIMVIILLEAAFLCVFGGIIGDLFGHLLVGGASPLLQDLAGIPLSPWVFLVSELYLFAGLLVLGVLVGLVPAMQAYRVEIADGLVPSV